MASREPVYETPTPDVLNRLGLCTVNQAHGKNYRRSPGGSGWICATCFPKDDPPDWQLTSYIRPVADLPSVVPSSDPREEMGEIPAQSADEGSSDS